CYDELWHGPAIARIGTVQECEGNPRTIQVGVAGTIENANVTCENRRAVGASLGSIRVSPDDVGKVEIAYFDLLDRLQYDRFTALQSERGQKLRRGIEHGREQAVRLYALGAAGRRQSR